MPFDNVWFWVFVVLGAIVALLAIVHFLRQQECKKIFFERRPQVSAFFEKEFRGMEHKDAEATELSAYLERELKRLNALTPKSNTDWEFAEAELHLLSIEMELFVWLKKLNDAVPRATQI